MSAFAGRDGLDAGRGSRGCSRQAALDDAAGTHHHRVDHSPGGANLCRPGAGGLVEQLRQITGMASAFASTQCLTPAALVRPSAQLRRQRLGLAKNAPSCGSLRVSSVHKPRASFMIKAVAVEVCARLPDASRGRLLGAHLACPCCRLRRPTVPWHGKDWRLRFRLGQPHSRASLTTLCFPLVVLSPPWSLHPLRIPTCKAPTPC